MRSTSARPPGTSNPNPGDRAQLGTGDFMLTLCALAAPVSIRPPQSPQLKPFTFFMSRARRPDGSEQLYLNMGYFETLADAEQWVEAVRRHYPGAFATVAPVGVRPAVEASVVAPDAVQPVVLKRSEPAPTKPGPLTDTQVLKILGSRRVSTVQGDVDESDCDQIALLRPDDTITRHALKEAVVQGAPVSFAVQLQWSTQPIDLNRVPSLAIFKAYTLYATETRRMEHCRYFLRLGFFADPISAKQVAVQVRSEFASAAVIPVVEQEVARAREASMGSSAIPSLVEQRVDAESDASHTPGSPAPSKPSSHLPRRVSQAAKTVEVREARAKSAMWTEPDSLSDSGVRHLRIEVQEHLSGRSRMVRLNPTPSNLLEIDSSGVMRE